MSVFEIFEDHHVKNICFPIPLPQQELFTILEETGFTKPEKVALRNGFKVLKRKSKQHALQIYLNFYTAHHLILERYRCGLVKFYLKELNEHTHWLVEKFISLVEGGLDNVVQFNIILTDIANRHKAQRFTESDITLLAQNIKNYILDVLNKMRTPSLVNSVTKLCQLIVVYHFGEDLNFLQEINNAENTTFSSEYDDKKKKLRASVQSIRTHLQSSSSGGLRHFGTRGGYEVRGPFKELHSSYMKKGNK